MHRVLAVSVVALLGCDPDPGTYETGVSCEWQRWIAYHPPAPQLDVVFMISDAPSMAPYRDQLVASLPRFATILETIEGGLPSVHVAIVDEDARFTSEPQISGCAPPDGPFLIDVAGPWFLCDVGDPGCRERNYQGTFADALACLGAVPANGEATPPLLERVVDALGDGNPDAAAFLRPDAYLLVVLIAAEDDASPGDPAAYAAALKQRKADDSMVIVSIVTVQPAPRLDALAEEFPNRASTISILSADWDDAVAILVGGPGPPVYNSCVDVPLDDLDPEMPGLQLGCFASEADGSTIPPCTMATDERPDPSTPLPCWWARINEEDAWWCPTFAVVERDGPPDELGFLRCPCD